VAYSSVSHLGFCVLGLMAINDIGVQGSVLYMINHGLSTGALFLVVGMVYDRFHTRDIDELSGLAKRMPRLAFFFVLFSLSSIGLPGLNGFVSEFLTVLGAFTSQWLGIGYAAIAALGIILGALYMLHMVARVIFGPLKVPGEGGGDHGAPASPAAHAGHGSLGRDIGAREITVLVPLAVLVVVLGVYPGPVLDSIAGPIKREVTRSVPERRVAPIATRPPAAPLAHGQAHGR
jgi:NADH-quinone oxidoreductase subunit M